MYRLTRALVLGSICATLAVPAAAHASDPVTEWNETAVLLTLGAVPAQAPVQQTRTMAIVQTAVHDAISGILGTYDTYGRMGPGPSGASPEGAAIAAAHHALTTLFPGAAASLHVQYAASLAANGVFEGDPGIEFGRAAAARILALRAHDGAALAQFDYTVPGAGQPGVWIRLGGAPALLPGWGAVTPFVLRSGGQFRPEAPPALTSELYAKDYNEVQAIGATDALNQLRTGEQTGIANFWRASPTAIWNGVLTQMLAVRSLDLAARARVYALMYLAAADSSIACWEAKYTYNFWRPFPAIVAGDFDGNNATAADPGWLPLLSTPPHPEYPSGHTSNSSAMVTVLRTLLGEDPGTTLRLTFFGVTREWYTLDEPLQEVIDARVYSGIHFRNSDRVGARLGRQVAQFVVTHALRPASGGWKK